MNDLVTLFNNIISENSPVKMIISKPRLKSNDIKKIVIEAKANGYQVSKYTEKQVFHENINSADFAQKSAELINGSFRQVNCMDAKYEHIILISKNGEFSYKKRALNSSSQLQINSTHNRKKNYLIPEGTKVAPLVDMGIFTLEGKVVNSMYDKYKQINRFLEIIDDEINDKKYTSLNIIDFGCGKSYLTFVVYYYLTQIKGINANVIGLDLKADVISKCNEAARKYGYDSLHFEVGDVNGYKAPFDVNMVITLHACDTATDYALYNAVNWKADLIFSVPCCQHELNKQLSPESLNIFSRYGIVKERFSALATDAIRANLLEYAGYKTQLLEFVDFDHTPKNILIRAVRRPMPVASVKKTALMEVDSLINEFNFEPTLYKLLVEK